MLDGLQNGLVVVFGTVHPRTDGPHLHALCREWLQQFFEVTVLGFTQPFRMVFFWQDHRHPGVHFGTSSFGSPVMIVQVCSHSLVDGSFQPSQSPANTDGESSFMRIARTSRLGAHGMVAMPMRLSLVSQKTGRIAVPTHIPESAEKLLPISLREYGRHFPTFLSNCSMLVKSSLE
jgi:hypothetical protein